MAAIRTDRWRRGCSLKISWMDLAASAVAVVLIVGAGTEWARAKVVEPEYVSFPCIVVDGETGKGIPNAVVTVKLFGGRQGDDTGKNVTDIDGKFTLEMLAERWNLPALDIAVVVEHDDYMKSGESNSAYSVSTIRQNELLGERPFFERITLRAASPLTGRVLQPDGTPLANTRVHGFTRAKMEGYSPVSWLDTRTDAEGRFRLKRFRDGVSAITIVPNDFAIIEKDLAQEAGDLGDIRLSPGVRIRGRALAADGQPAAGIYVNAEIGGAHGYESRHGVGSGVRRSVMTDNMGRFELSPLPAGDYRVESSEREPFGGNHPFPGVFVARTVTLAEAEVAPIELRAVPHIHFHAQYVTSQGEKTAGHRLQVTGMMNGHFWRTGSNPDQNGNAVMRLPRGLQDAHVMLCVSDDSALGYRSGPAAPLGKWDSGIRLGTLNDDFAGFEIIRYKSPIVLVKAVDEAGQPIPNFQSAAIYPWRKNSGPSRPGELPSHIEFVQQEDGRHRTTQMFPNEDITFTAVAAGYQPASQVVKLPEGESKELVLTLKKLTENEK